MDARAVARAGIAFNADGTRLVAVGTGGAVRVWDPGTGGLLAHEGGIAAVAFSPDASRLVVVGADTVARVWEIATGRLAATAPDVLTAAFSPDGVWLAAADGTGRLTLRSLTEDRERVELMHSVAVREVAFSPDGRTVATVTDDGAAWIWDLETQTPQATETAAVTAVAFSPDGTLLATGHAEGGVRLWDRRDGTAVVLAHASAVRCVAFSPDGARLASASADGTARLWDVDSGQPLTQAADAVAVAFSPDGARLAIAGTRFAALLWDPRSFADPVPLWCPESVPERGADAPGAALIAGLAPRVVPAVAARQPVGSLQASGSPPETPTVPQVPASPIAAGAAATPPFPGAVMREALAGPGQRLGAFLLDLTVLFMGMGAGVVVQRTLRAAGLVLPVGLAAGLVLFIPLYFAVLEGSPAGQTIGKRVVGIRVVKAWTGERLRYGRALGRTFSRYLSLMLYGLGYWWLLWDRHRQAWHDKIVGSVVVRAPASAPVDAAEPATPAGKRFASSAERLRAAVADALVVALPAWLITVVTGGAPFIVAALPLAGVYGIAAHATARGQTLGQRLEKIHVVDASSGAKIGLGRSVVRWLVASLVLLAPMVAVVEAFWYWVNCDPRLWHDRAAGSAVVTGREPSALTWWS